MPPVDVDRRERADRAAQRAMATAAAAATAGAAARVSVRALRDVRGVVNMPTRAIAAVLLQTRRPIPHEELYDRANEYGLFNSRRHFKHCLKMMKGQDRVRVICDGPRYPGASRRAFSVELTRRGDAIYTRYLGEKPPPPSDPNDIPGLADAL